MMAMAFVVFNSDSNRAHFVIDWSEALNTRTRTVVIDDDGRVTCPFFEEEREELADMAARYGGEVEWNAEAYNIDEGMMDSDE